MEASPALTQFLQQVHRDQDQLTRKKQGRAGSPYVPGSILVTGGAGFMYVDVGGVCSGFDCCKACLFSSVLCVVCFLILLSLMCWFCTCVCFL